MIGSKFTTVLTLFVSMSQAFAGNLLAPPRPNIPFAEKKQYEDYWKELGIKFLAVKRVLSPTNCYQNATKFIGCYEALSTLISSTNPSFEEIAKTKAPFRALTLKSELMDSKIVYKTLYEADGIAVTEVDPKAQKSMAAAGKPKGPAQVKAENKAAEAKTTAELKAIYQATRSKPISFVAFADWEYQNYLSKKPELESYATGIALNAYLSVAKDPHTSLDPIDFWDDQGKAGAGEENFFGIGAELRVNEEKVYIVKPKRNSPALKAGLRANDQILEVKDDGTGEDYKIPGTPDLQVVTSKIRGMKDTAVTLKILRDGKEIDVKIVRGPIVQGENVESYLVQEFGLSLGYIRLGNFQELRACEKVNQAVQDLTAQGAKGLILDLRGNGGGLLDFAACIGSVFVGPDQTVVFQKSLIPGVIPNQTTVTQSSYVFQGEDEAGKPQTVKIKIKPTSLPMVTLINAGSASASEIVSGMLQQSQRSLIVGERSYGKATVQTLSIYAGIQLQLPQQDPFSARELGLTDDNGGTGIPFTAATKLYYHHTIQRFYLAKDYTNQIVGIKPDVEAYVRPNATDDDKVAYREEDEYSSLPPAGTPSKVVFPNLAKIKECMKAGEAAKYFVTHQKDAIVPDYQILSSEEAIGCLLTAGM